MSHYDDHNDEDTLPKKGHGPMEQILQGLFEDGSTSTEAEIREQLASYGADPDALLARARATIDEHTRRRGQSPGAEHMEAFEREAREREAQDGGLR